MVWRRRLSSLRMVLWKSECRVPRSIGLLPADYGACSWLAHFVPCNVVRYPFAAPILTCLCQPNCPRLCAGSRV